MSSLREESDSFGSVQLPEQALYGVQTVRTLENLSFSDRQLYKYPTYIQSLALVKKAAAHANQQAGVLDEIMTTAIKEACDQLIAGAHHKHFPVDVLHGGGGIGTNSNVNEVIANLANEALGGSRGCYTPIHPNEYVNASQSTSDVCHTAIRLAIIKSMRPLIEAIEHLIEALRLKSVEFKSIRTISRTCLQDGMSVYLGASFQAYRHMLARRLQSLQASILDLHAINLGGTVMGSGVGAPQVYRNQILSALNETTGMTLFHRESLYDAAQHIDDLGKVSAEISLLATGLVKLAKDLRLLSSGPEAGFAEVQLPAVQAGSSFFPGKINPVIPETLIQCCFQVFGCDRVVQAALEHGELNLNVFEGAAGVNLLDAIVMLERVLPNFTEKCINGITANLQRCEELATSYIPLVVELKEQVGYTTATLLIKEHGKEDLKKLIQTRGTNDDKSESNGTI